MVANSQVATCGKGGGQTVNPLLKPAHPGIATSATAASSQERRKADIAQEPRLGCLSLGLGRAPSPMLEEFVCQVIFLFSTPLFLLLAHCFLFSVTPFSRLPHRRQKHSVRQALLCGSCCYGLLCHAIDIRFDAGRIEKHKLHLICRINLYTFKIYVEKTLFNNFLGCYMGLWAVFTALFEQ